MQTQAIVTGAAGDIGRAIVARLLDAGHVVRGWDIDTAGLEANDARWAEDVYRSERVNLLEMEEVRAAADHALAGKEPVALLVNNAGGVTAATSLKRATEPDMRRDLDLNLMAAWRCIECLRRELARVEGAAVVNVASINGTGVYGFPGYSAAKAGLLHLTRFAAVELGKEGIRVNAVAPGTVRTQAWDSRAARDPNLFESIAGWYPMRAICEPDDVAAAVAFLAGRDARMITGVTLPVDGGLGAGVDRLAGELIQEDI